jgi:antitoxin component YwqK of YwqJK toxin-antitoxin module
MKNIIYLLSSAVLTISNVYGQDAKTDLIEWAKLKFNFQCDSPTAITVEIKDNRYFLNYDCNSEYGRTTECVELKVYEEEFTDGSSRLRVHYRLPCTKWKYYDQKIKSNSGYTVYNSKGYVTEVGGYHLIDDGGYQGPDLGDDTPLQPPRKKIYDTTNVIFISKFKGNDYASDQMSECFGGEKPYKTTAYYEDKSVKSIYDLEDGSFTFYNQGVKTPDYKLGLKNGEFHGNFTSHYKNEQIKIIASYNEGKLHGSYEEFTESGRLKIKASYNDGEFDGYYSEFSENGDTIQCGNYANGKKIGEWRETVPLKSLDIINIGVIYSILGVNAFSNDLDRVLICKIGAYNDEGFVDGKIKIKTLDNKTLAIYTKNRYDVDGELILYYADGKILGKAIYEAGTLTGARFYDVNGSDISGQVISEYNERMTK